jgi:glucosamine kinase
MLRAMTSASPPPANEAPGPCHAQRLGLGLGLDGGGTATRWALAAADGRLLAAGEVGGISGLMLADASGRARLQACASALATQLAQQLAAGNPATDAARDVARDPTRDAEPGAAPASARSPRAVVGRIVAGLSGYASADEATLQTLLAAPFGLPAAAVQLMTDIELACRAAFAPGAGIVVYAGTGSIAAHLDAKGQLLRAGGRGALIDDAGGGVWIATRALRALWRLEDAQPGAAARTALGRAVSAQLGGPDWAHTRAWVYGSATQPPASRGELGRLALAVAAAAQQGDAQALALLQAAGRELAALARRLRQQCQSRGLPPLPLAPGGRVWLLHPAVREGFIAAMPAGTDLQAVPAAAEQAAARLAATQSGA